jgi:hypothetical protein
VLTQAPLPQQDDLLAILGTFATPYIKAEQFIAMVGRERLMSSELFEYLMKDREAELQDQIQQRDEQRRQELQTILEDTLLIRFPAMPHVLARDIRRITDPATLSQLIVAVQQVSDLAAATQLVRDAAGQAEGS